LRLDSKPIIGEAKQQVCQVRTRSSDRVCGARLSEGPVEVELAGHLSVTKSFHTQPAIIKSRLEVVLAKTLRKNGRKGLVDVVVPRPVPIAQGVARERGGSSNDGELATHHLADEIRRESQSPRIETIHFTRRVKDIREAIKAVSNREHCRRIDGQQVVDRRHVD